MSRFEFSHIAWSKAEPARHRFNLAESGVAAPDLEGLGLPHQAGLPSNGYADLLPELEAGLGAWVAAPGRCVLVTAGASEANACVYAGLLSPGDEVLVESPGYEPHRALAGLFGFRLARFTRRREHGHGDVATAVEATLSPATRMVVVSHLHNPSGAALEAADVEALDRLAERHGFWVLCDETFRDAGPLPLGTLASRGPRWVSTSSLTKAYGLGGLRIGWIAGSPEALARCAAAQNGLSVQPALPSVAMARALMPHLDRLRARARGILVENHAVWTGFAARRPAAGRNGHEFDAGVPPLGTTAWSLFHGEREGDSFCEFAAARFDLAATPGRFFGDPRGLRVGLGSEPSQFAVALEQLEQALAAFFPTRAGTGALA